MGTGWGKAKQQSGDNIAATTGVDTCLMCWRRLGVRASGQEGERTGAIREMIRTIQAGALVGTFMPECQRDNIMLWGVTTYQNKVPCETSQVTIAWVVGTSDPHLIFFVAVCSP